MTGVKEVSPYRGADLHRFYLARQYAGLLYDSFNSLFHTLLYVWCCGSLMPGKDGIALYNNAIEMLANQGDVLMTIF